MAKGKKFGLGIILGAVAGVVTGILTAPKSGKETRQDLKDKAADLRGSAERKLKDAHKELDKMAADARVKASKLQGQAKAELDDYAKKADQLKEKAKVAITSIKNGDGDSDEASVDKLLKEFVALKDKVVGHAKDIKDEAKKKS